MSEGFAISSTGAIAGTAVDKNGRAHGLAFESSLRVFEADTDLRGINSSGSIIGTRGNTATIWSGAGSENLSVGGGGSWGLGISDTGYATGAALGVNGAMHGFQWFNGHMVDVGSLGGNWTAGYAVNNAGQVAGVSTTANGGQSAFLWDQKTGMRLLAGLGNTSDTRAFAINSAGNVAGISATRDGYHQAALWNVSGEVTSLGALGGGYSFAYGVNDSNDVVGYSYDVEGNQRAVLWVGGLLFDLNTLIGDSEWDLTAAYGINASGQIVGTGYHNGISSVFRLDPELITPSLALRGNSSAASFQDLAGSEVPEPATMLPLALAAAAGFVLRKRKAPYTNIK